MTIVWIAVALGLFAIAVVFGIEAQKLKKRVAESSDRERAAAEEVDRLRVHFQGEAIRLQKEIEASIKRAEENLNQRLAEAERESEQARGRYEAQLELVRSGARQGAMKAQEAHEARLTELARESENVRQHYQAEARKAVEASEALLNAANKELESLRKYESLRESEAEVRRRLAETLEQSEAMHREAEALLEASRLAAEQERANVAQKAEEFRQQAEALLAQATREAGRILAKANRRAEEIAGDAFIALREKQSLENTVTALKNVVEGYGDRYVVPSRSVLDDLAADFGHTAAGERLRSAREHSRRMVELGEAATCDYVDQERRATAIRFVVDAFNGRVDAALSRTRDDNYGTLKQEISDAFSLVNQNGKAFKNCQILPAYLDARLAELRYGVVAQELKLKEREEQRRIQDQIREEEKARREYERAMKEAAREEEIIRRAMEKARSQAEDASADERGKFEAQLADLNEKLREAEARNQRAISMAQQTRRGHVYIISNVGSFGENIYKIGLTRRLEPLDRIYELGDSSVPFDFDVHALIFSEDAPALELQLHNHFLLHQVNKVDHRKEFFRVDIRNIREELEKLGISCAWTMIAAAAEYRETLVIERKIRDNPELREAWVNRQLELEVSEPVGSDPERGCAGLGGAAVRNTAPAGEAAREVTLGI